MILYPEIGLKDGRCATWRRGQMPLPIYHDGDPVEIARRFALQGAEWLHVTDLDAVGRRRRDNADLVRAIIRAVDIPVQVSGGIAKLGHVNQWLGDGAECVVIGSAAVLNPALVHRAALHHPDRVLVAMDVANGRVMVNGWTRPTEHEPLDFAMQFARLDLAGVIVNDMDYDRALPEGSLAVVKGLADRLPLPVIASGLAKSRDDLSTLKLLDNVAGAIVGRALHDGTFSLEEALTLIWEADPREIWWRRAPPAPGWDIDRSSA